MIRRAAREERGVALGLAVIVVVIVGVMGAGLLTFVVTDLNAVVEVNRGQRAFEMAEAGVRIAERQLASNHAKGSYDGGADEVRWSAGWSGSSEESGVTLTDLDGDPATPDSVKVTIETLPEPAGSFEAVSTGAYGDTRRRVEATFSFGAEGLELRSWRELYE